MLQNLNYDMFLKEHIFLSRVLKKSNHVIKRVFEKISVKKQALKFLRVDSNVVKHLIL